MLTARVTEASHGPGTFANGWKHLVQTIQHTAYVMERQIPDSRAVTIMASVKNAMLDVLDLYYRRAFQQPRTDAQSLSDD